MAGGWDASFWDAVAGRIQGLQQQRVERGFFGAPPSSFNDEAPAILIGHSLGFVHGLNQKKNWHGWIAINSFPRFVTTDSNKGCVTAAELRDMRMRLESNVRKTLRNFHALIGAEPPQGSPDIQKLRGGLNELRDSDIASDLKNPATHGLVLASRQDPLVPTAASEALAESHSVIWHEKGGHILPHSDPDWCAAHIKTFVRRHESILA